MLFRSGRPAVNINEVLDKHKYDMETEATALADKIMPEVLAYIIGLDNIDIDDLEVAEPGNFAAAAFAAESLRAFIIKIKGGEHVFHKHYPEYINVFINADGLADYNLIGHNDDNC